MTVFPSYAFGVEIMSPILGFSLKGGTPVGVGVAVGVGLGVGVAVGMAEGTGPSAGVGAGAGAGGGTTQAINSTVVTITMVTRVARRALYFRFFTTIVARAALKESHRLQFQFSRCLSLLSKILNRLAPLGVRNVVTTIEREVVLEKAR